MSPAGPGRSEPGRAGRREDVDATALGKQVGPGRGGGPRGGGAAAAPRSGSRLRFSPPLGEQELAAELGGAGRRSPEDDVRARGAAAGAGCGRGGRAPSLLPSLPFPSLPSFPRPPRGGGSGRAASLRLGGPLAAAGQGSSSPSPRFAGPGVGGCWWWWWFGGGGGMLPSVRLDMFGRLIGIRKTGGEGGKVLRNTFSSPLPSQPNPNLVGSVVRWGEKPGYPAPARALPACPRSSTWRSVFPASLSRWNAFVCSSSGSSALNK